MEIVWEPSFSVKVDILDKQHIKILDIMNECNKFVQEDIPGENIPEMLHALHEYTDEHFALEEDYMRKAGYFDLRHHIELHWYFIKSVMDLEEEYQNTGQIKQKGIIRFLANWFINHILNDDSDYSETLNEAGYV